MSNFYVLVVRIILFDVLVVSLVTSLSAFFSLTRERFKIKKILELTLADSLEKEIYSFEHFLG